MITVLRAFRREPRPSDVPRLGAHDRLLAGVVAAAVLAEGILRPGVSWRPLVTVLTLAVAAALMWRRSHPLAAVVVGWGVAAALSVIQLAAQVADVGLNSMLVVVVLLYSLIRWGSGREILLGVAFVAAAATLGMFASASGRTNVVGGAALLVSVVALAAVFRSRADLWQRRQLEIRNQERVALARELHDTVAHHVSAIAVQAQAGRVIAGPHPEKAEQIFATIESEATGTLTEMRAMVRLLREDDPASFAPARGIADLPALADTVSSPRVELWVDRTIPDLPPHLDAAVYRLAQESLTNAVRHARQASFVTIEVRRKGDNLHLRVTDNGHTEPNAAPEPGFGLRGMAERARLLGGSFSAGPRPEGGWTMVAVLPLKEPA